MNKSKLYKNIITTISQHIKHVLNEGYFDDMFDEKDEVKDNSLLGDIIDNAEDTENKTLKSVQFVDNQTPLLLAYSSVTGFNKVPKGFKHITPSEYNHPQYFEYISNTVSRTSGKGCMVELYNHLGGKWTLYENEQYFTYKSKNYNEDCGGTYLRYIKMYVINPHEKNYIPVDINIHTTLSDIEDVYKKFNYTNIFNEKKNDISNKLQSYKQYVKNIQNQFIKKLFGDSNFYEYALVSPDGGLVLTRKMILTYNPKKQDPSYYTDKDNFYITIFSNETQQEYYINVKYEYKLTFTGNVLYDNLMQYTDVNNMKMTKLRNSLDIVEEDDYFIVTGNTYKIKDKIKNLNAKFSYTQPTSYGETRPGWKIPNDKRDEFEEIFK